MLNEVPLCGTNTNPLPQVCKGLSGVKIPQVLINQVSFKCPSANAEVPKCTLRVQVPKHLKCRSAKFRGPPSTSSAQDSEVIKCL